MYVEKRKFGKRIKYYLVYSYREGGKVKKIRKYLGIDLSNNELEIAKKKFGKEFPDLVKHLGSEIFSFRLTKKQIDVLNKYNDRIKVVHLSEFSKKQDLLIPNIGWISTKFKKHKIFENIYDLSPMY